MCQKKLISQLQENFHTDGRTEVGRKDGKTDEIGRPKFIGPFLLQPGFKKYQMQALNFQVKQICLTLKKKTLVPYAGNVKENS